MQDAERDLRCYVAARQLHLAATLRQVFERNSLAYPLFYSCLDPRARQLTVLILLSLQRWLRQGLHDEESTDTSSTMAAALAMGRASDVYVISRHIVSYLSFPDLVTVQPPTSLLVDKFHQLRLEQEALVAAASTPASASAPTAATAQSPGAPVAGGASAEGTPRLGATQPDAAQGTPAGVGSVPATPQRPALDSTAVADPDTKTDHEATPHRPTAATVDSTPVTRTSADPSAAVAAASSQSLVEAMKICQPMFYCRAPLQESTAGTTGTGPRGHHHPVRRSTHTLFVRMVHHSLLNEETLNTYFGRYGQTGCTLVRRIPLTEMEQFSPREVLLALSEAFQRPPQQLFVQDFLISTDSSANAQRAVDHASHKELLFAALHDPALNTHALGDVDLIVMRCTALALKKPSYGAPWGVVTDAGAEGDTDTTAAGGAARMDRRRRRKRHRRGALRRDGSASASSQSSEDGDGRSSARSSASSEEDGDTSSSLDETEAGDGGDEPEFVPDILVDGFPYWATEDQLKLLFKECGNVLSIQTSTHDLSGAFTGCVLVRMETADEAIRVCQEVHGRNYDGNRLVAGVLNEKLELVSVTNPRDVRQMGVADPQFIVTRNERLWA